MKGGKRDVQPAQSVVIINKPEDSEDAANVGDLVKILQRNIKRVAAHDRERVQRKLHAYIRR